MLRKNKKIIIFALIAGLAIFSGVYFGVIRNTAAAKLARQINQAPEIKNIYKLDKVSLVLPAKDENSAEIKVGESDAKEFTPNLEISRWDGEVSMKIEPDVSNVSASQKSLSFDGEKIKFTTPDIEYNFYDLSNSTNGIYEFETVFKSKPTTNIVSFDIKTTNVVFLYQPDVENNKYIGKDGKEHFSIPENVIGSYSIYSQVLPFNDNKIHSVGAAFTILRPQIIDADGNKVWGEMNINEKEKKMTITIPQDFLDKAVYPVIVDPTIALVNHTTVTGQSGATTPAIVTTNATLLVAITLGWNTAAPTPSDSKSNSWTPLTNRTNGEANVKISYVVNPIVGTEHTFSVTGGYATIFVLAFSGTLITSDVYGGQESTGNAAIGAATLTLGSITPAENNEVVVSGTACANDNDTSWINDVLSVTDTQPSGASLDGGAGYLVQTTAIAIAPVWTRGATDKVAVGTMATFKAAPAGASCGDGTCNGDETCVSCSADCGTCKALLRRDVILKRNVVFGRPAAAPAATPSWGGEITGNRWYTVTSANPITLTLTAGIADGKTIVLFVSSPNSGTEWVSSVTDDLW